MTTPLFLTADQVATTLGLLNAKAFHRQRARLEADTHFPPPMPTQRKPLRWRADELQAWIERQGTPDSATHSPALPDPATIPRGKGTLIAIARTA